MHVAAAGLGYKIAPGVPILHELKKKHTCVLNRM